MEEPMPTRPAWPELISVMVGIVEVASVVGEDVPI